MGILDNYSEFRNWFNMILGGFYISLEIDKNFEKIRGDSLRLCKDLLLLTLQIIIYGIL